MGIDNKRYRGDYMARPFEGVFGNTAELRVMEFLLPLKELDFNISELADEVGISRPTATKVVNKFVEYNVMKISRTQSGTTYYDLNGDSPFVKLFEDLNNLIIEQMLDEDILNQIHDFWQSDIKNSRIAGKKPELIPDVSEIIGSTELPWPSPSDKDYGGMDVPFLDDDQLYGGGSNAAG